LLFRFEERVDLFAKRVGFVDDFLGLFAVVPEGFRSHQGVQLGQAFLGAWDVKETSASA
jgi:hypothetical protein